MRLLRRLADALLLATTIIFPSLRASRRGNPSSRVIASQPAKQSHTISYKIMPQQYYVYILTNKTNSVLYTGITNNLIRRVYEHKQKLIPGFTCQYNVNKLVYFEEFIDPENAILREKQIKAGSRQKKISLIEKQNSNYLDLYDKIVE